jgi:hypothetical protein
MIRVAGRSTEGVPVAEVLRWAGVPLGKQLRDRSLDYTFWSQRRMAIAPSSPFLNSIPISPTRSYSSPIAAPGAPCQVQRDPFGSSSPPKSAMLDGCGK